MEDLNFDGHIHSKYSHDSLMEPKTILKKAKKAGLSGLAITDHNTIGGALAARQYEKTYGLTVTIGAEIGTDIGDIIGLDLHEEIGARRWVDVIREIKDQGGIAVLPHPYRSHTNVAEVAHQVDVIEIWNARSTAEENMKAAHLANVLGKKVLYGSDAHTYTEIGNVNTRVNPETWEMKEVISSTYAPKSAIVRSQVISHMKRRQFAALIRHGWAFVFKR